MPLMLQRAARGLLPVLDATRPPAHCMEPVKIVLDTRPGHPPSSRPPVRIFLGTERGQFRAERIFLWSIEKHRDPGRVYEVFLMKHLTGFRDRFWLTAFTNYRFAVPGFCDYQGKAIYNDVDQIYLTDPGELFDHDMGHAGFLSINDRDTSVMLIDCARMARVWPAAAARARKRNALEAAARSAGLWGSLEAIWNARDREYDPEKSKLVHFTTLHTQPWRPFPEHFVYFEGPTGTLWPDLETEADAAGFMPVNSMRPSATWHTALSRIQALEDGRTFSQMLADADERPVTGMPDAIAVPCAQAEAPLHVRGVLEIVPDDDLPWVLDRLFARSRSIELEVNDAVLPRVDRQRRAVWFWQQQLEAAAARHPGTRWQLRRRCGLSHLRLEGGVVADGPIVALRHRKPGHDHQTLAVAGALATTTGRPMLQHNIAWSATGYLLRRAFGGGRLPGLPRDAAAVVAAGWLPTRVARRSTGNARLVLLGRKAGRPPIQGGMVVQCRHFGLPCHPNRLTTLLPLNAGVSAPTAHPESWHGWAEAAHRVALLIGGTSRSHRLDAGAARALGAAASDWARQQQARLLVVTGRRTGAVARHLAAMLRADDEIYLWRPDDPDNPYALALHHADALLVTGESESTLADAVASGRPVLVWPLPRRRQNPWQAVCSWVAEQATSPRYNRRGSIRPQQGIGYLCARALERGWALPPRNLEALHDVLYYRGLAARFGDEAEQTAPAPFQELDLVSRRLAHRLGLVSARAPRLFSDGAPDGHDTAS
jgi:uncharacterized protein